MFVLLINSCALFGGSTYVNSWLGINYLVIAASFTILAFLYMLSRFFPGATKSKVSSLLKVDMAQLMLSVVIILILLGMSQLTCNITSSLSQTLVGTSLSPFQYADFYIGNLAMNTGLKLLGTIYRTSVTYAIDASVLTKIGEASPLHSLGNASVVGVDINIGQDFGAAYGSLSDVYFDLFAPFTIVAIGALFLQYISLPLIEFTAFVVVLPVALVLRSISLTGSGLRTTANAFLAIAIAAYLVYPLMIAFNAYAIHWIFSGNNPLYGCTGCISTAYSLNNLPSSSFFNSVSSQGATFDGITTPAISSLIGSTYFSNLGAQFDPIYVVSSAQTLITEISQFIFTAIFMFGIDITVTIGFAMGLANGLNSGVEGAGSFWGSL